MQFVMQIWKSSEGPRADAATARLVTRKCGAVEDHDVPSRTGERARGRGSRRSAADDEHLSVHQAKMERSSAKSP
jgi:hypothetical protein